MKLPRSVPTPRARRIWTEIETLTIYDLLFLRDQFHGLLGEPPVEGAGVREPRRPYPYEGGTAIALVEDDVA